MYGLIFENFSGYLKHKYGDEAWDQIRRLANLDSPTFSIHQASWSKSRSERFGLTPILRFMFAGLPGAAPWQNCQKGLHCPGL